jgi:ATP-binding cassette, subfamily B, bacterial
MKSSQTKNTIKIYIDHIKKYRTLVIGGLLVMPFTILAGNFLPPLVIANVIDRLSRGDYIKGDVIGSFGPSILIYTIILFLSVFLWRGVDYFIWRLEAKVLQDLAQTIYKHLLDQSADFHANSFGGSLVSQSNKMLSAYVRISDTTVYAALPLFWGILFTSLILLTRAPLFVITFNITAFLYITLAIYITRGTRVSSAKFADAESKQTGVLADSITNVLAIKSYSNQQFENDRFKTYSEKTKKAHYSLMKLIAIQITSFGGFNRIVQIAALVAAVISIVNYNVNLATVFLILSYSSTIADQLFSFTNNSLRHYNRSFGDASEMTRILTQKTSIKDPSISEVVTPPVGDVAFNNVTFTHTGSDKSLFQGFNLSLQKGEKVGLVGHSGSGKSTLTRLLLRFSDIDSGSITVDGQDIKNITQDDLHNKITYVPQEPMLFHRSLSENIGYGKQGASLNEVKKVATLSNADEFIKDLPKGYDTLVGERGIKLSGGQRQRIAIARAMIKDSPIVVLDEATSALDSHSEKLIQESLWKLMEGRTALVIAHRLSTIQKMDRILVLDNGRIIEEGSHQELLKKNGKYAELWAHQSGGFIED